MVDINIKDLKDLDLYELFGVNFSVSTTEIKKAYRRKALECHPDKNPDNPKASELFQQLSKALEILADEAARAAYDKILNAKKAAALRHKELDSKRQKLKSDLEAREKHAELHSKDYKAHDLRTPEELLQAEIDRLRTEGSKLVEEEQELLRKQVQAQKYELKNLKWDSSKHRIKIKWNTSKGDDKNGGYNEENLNRFLSKYGDIVALVLSKKRGSGIVEFRVQEAAEMAVQFEQGLAENKLTLQWIGDAPSKGKGKTLINERDYESLVLRQMRQAEERKKLIQQMQQEDE